MTTTMMTLPVPPSKAVPSNISSLTKMHAPSCIINNLLSMRRGPVLTVSFATQHQPPSQAQGDASNESDQRKGKFFVDDQTGVVCYQNEQGETICEGLDEGPHLEAAPKDKNGRSNTDTPGNAVAAGQQPMYEI
ncbi:hypothetical protein KP509_11G017100 [Ceratopteris richardii]|uniref:Uncharacterized protein n=1 Tax=Ceratopteris richardii TaxID=49495 RepID=A0A8T2TME7_CERRI|nr:hypothetical protein KP509_11G017100 [Ceratopteris richardii]KAH7424642.1 hypothetical protein KP509_11G017100 [Ceratopteris richardii]